MEKRKGQVVVEAGGDSMVFQSCEEAGRRLHQRQQISPTGTAWWESVDTNSRGIGKLDYILLGNGVAMSCQSHWQSRQEGTQPWPNRGHDEEKYIKEWLDSK